MKNLISTQAMRNAHNIAMSTEYTFSVCLKLGWKVAKGELSIKQAKKTKEFSFNALLTNIGSLFESLVMACLMFLIVFAILITIQMNTGITFDYGLIFISVYVLMIATNGDEFKSIFNKTIERV